MKAPNLHLNLLREAEKVSSSPVRLRVMLPIFALLLCAGCAIWWAILFMQLMLLRGQVSSLRSDLDGKKSAHAAILAEMARARDLQAELDQLQAYSKGRRTWGGLLAKFADVMPMNVQLTSLSIPEPLPQNLANPANPRMPPLLGPTNVAESVSFRLTGRTVKADPVMSLLATLGEAPFHDWLVAEKRGVNPSPRVHSFRQEAAVQGGEGKRLLAFDVEFRCPERRFEK